MKFNAILLPTLTLLAGAVADNLGDCSWERSIVMDYPQRDQFSLKYQCPPPQKDGDVYTEGILNMNKCLVNSHGNIKPRKDGGAFNSIDALDCFVDDPSKTIKCKGHGSVAIADFVHGQGDSFGCYGHTASTTTTTQLPKPTESPQ